MCQPWDAVHESPNVSVVHVTRPGRRCRLRRGRAYNCGTCFAHSPPVARMLHRTKTGPSGDRRHVLVADRRLACRQPPGYGCTRQPTCDGRRRPLPPGRDQSSAPADLVELLELANGTQHRAVRGSLIPTLYNLVPVMDMLSTRQMLQGSSVASSVPAPGQEDSDPAGARPRTGLTASCLSPTRLTPVTCTSIARGRPFGCVWQWYAEGGIASAPWWASVGEMIDDIACAFVEGRPALQSYANGAVWPAQRLSAQLAEVDEGYLRWSAA